MTAIIDYDAGNTRSVANALERLNAPYIITSEVDAILACDRLILPGVGHAADAIEKLKSKNLIGLIQNYSKPFLGICLGMQLMFESSEEGDTDCLGILPGRVARFHAENDEKVPHMGWNDIRLINKTRLFHNSEMDQQYYFVHSYFAPVGDFTAASCDYINRFSAVVVKDNFTGVQFHPEKSGIAGQNILSNFLKIR